MAELLRSTWSDAVSNAPKHRPQVMDWPSTTVRKEWCRRPQEAHVVDGKKIRRMSVAEIAAIQDYLTPIAKIELWDVAAKILRTNKPWPADCVVEGYAQQFDYEQYRGKVGLDAMNRPKDGMKYGLATKYVNAADYGLAQIRNYFVVMGIKGLSNTKAYTILHKLNESQATGAKREF